MLIIVVAIIILVIYLACPLIGKIVLLAANTFIPDPIPFVDEAIMWIGLLFHMVRVLEIAAFVSEHKVLSFFIACAVLIFIIICACFIFNFVF